MKVKYKDCEIEAKREKCLAGYDLIYYSIFDGDYEVTSGFYDTDDTVREIIKDLKATVDDYKEHEKEWKEDAK